MGSRELVEAGSTVAVRVRAELVASGGKTWKAEAMRSLAWNLRDRRYIVGIPAEARTVNLDNADAAITLVSHFPGLSLCPVSALASGGRVTFLASVGLIDSGGTWHDAPVLWNYVRPTATFSFGSPTEVPF